MKKLFALLSFACTMFLILPAFVADGGGKPFFPKKVDKVIHDKCYGCHSSEGRSEKARQALLWDDLANLPKADQAAKLKNIVSVLEEGSMPPKWLIEKHPEAAMSEKEAATLKKWAMKAAK